MSCSIHPKWYHDREDCPYCMAVEGRQMPKLKNDVPEEPKREFTSGAATSGDLPPFECLTETFLRRSAERMRLGLHYGKHNWKKGVQDKKFIQDRLNHALIHLVRAQASIDSDILTDDDNLAAVVVNCMFAMEYQIPVPAGEVAEWAKDFSIAPGDKVRLEEALHQQLRLDFGPPLKSKS